MFPAKLRILKTNSGRFLNQKQTINLLKLIVVLSYNLLNIFCEKNSVPMFSGIIHAICDKSTSTINDTINQPFTIEELKSSYKRLKNNKTNGVDNVVNEFF